MFLVLLVVLLALLLAPWLAGENPSPWKFELLAFLVTLPFAPSAPLAFLLAIPCSLAALPLVTLSHSVSWLFLLLLSRVTV